MLAVVRRLNRGNHWLLSRSRAKGSHCHQYNGAINSARCIILEHYLKSKWPLELGSTTMYHPPRPYNNNIFLKITGPPNTLVDQLMESLLKIVFLVCCERKSFWGQKWSLVGWTQLIPRGSGHAHSPLYCPPSPPPLSSPPDEPSLPSSSSTAALPTLTIRPHSPSTALISPPPLRAILKPSIYLVRWNLGLVLSAQNNQNHQYGFFEIFFIRLLNLDWE